MKIRAWSSLALASTMLLVGIAACGGGTSNGGGGSGTTTTTTTTTSHLITGTTTNSTSGGPACGLLYTDGSSGESDGVACEACMEGSCCTELDTCADPTGDCYALLACANACPSGDQACVNGCVTSHSTGYDDYMAIDSCFYKNCKTDPGCEYPVSCGGKKTANLLIPDDKCATCLATNCCTEYTTCDADATCGQCGPYVPVDQNPTQCAANAAFTAAESCTTTKCAAVCNFMGICDSGRSTQDNACDYAIGTGCCAEFKACIGDTGCTACFGAASCTNANFATLKTCWNTSAATDCGTL